jgi:hypothetical protein
MDIKNKKGKSFVYGEVTEKKRLSEAQLQAMFKRVYGKEPSVSEFQQFKLYHQGIL